MKSYLGPKQQQCHLDLFVCCLFVVGARGEEGGSGGVVRSGGGRLVMSWHGW